MSVLVHCQLHWQLKITPLARTYPTSGTFTKPQAELYSAVLSVQKSLIALCTVDSGHTLATLHQKSIELFKEALNNVRYYFICLKEDASAAIVQGWVFVI